MTRKFTNTLAAIVLMALPGAALADVALGDNAGTSADAVRSWLNGQGFVVNEVVMENGEIGADAMIGGKTYRIHISSSSGNVTRIERSAEDSADNKNDNGNGNSDRSHSNDRNDSNDSNDSNDD